MPSLGLVANVYNEINALPGWLECHLPFADDVRVLHAGPGGSYSTDGTIELLEKWRIPVEFCKIDEGFGVVRTKAIRMSPCDWVMLLDADERFYQHIPVMDCKGTNTPRDVTDALLYDYGNPNYAKDGPRSPQVLQSFDKDIDFSSCPSNFENMRLLGANLSVTHLELYDQGTYLRQLIADHVDALAIKSSRRHWHDFSLRRPTQNWHAEPDYQLRILRNVDSVYFLGRMHECVVGASCVADVQSCYGPFFEHFHLHFKRMESEQRRHDVAIYNAIHDGKQPPTLCEFKWKDA